MPRFLRIAQVVLIALVLLSGGAMVLLTRTRSSSSADFPAPVQDATFVIPPFQLIDQDGRAFTRDDLLGKISVLSVVFTNCPLACPTMTEKMSAVADAVVGSPIQFVSISIDPIRDRPERLREYRLLHGITGIKADRWRHLTSNDGSDAVVREIVENGLRAALEVDKSRPIRAHDGSEMFNVMHPTWFFVIDGRDGLNARVLELYQSSNDADMQRLTSDLRKFIQ